MRTRTIVGFGSLALAGAAGILVARRAVGTRPAPPRAASAAVGASTAASDVAARTRGRDDDDRALASRIRATALTSAPGVDVNVDGGIVYLRGRLDDAVRASDVIAGIRAIDGVEDVVNLMTLPPPVDAGARQADDH